MNWKFEFDRKTTSSEFKFFVQFTMPKNYSVHFEMLEFGIHFADHVAVELSPQSFSNPGYGYSELYFKKVDEKKRKEIGSFLLKNVSDSFIQNKNSSFCNLEIDEKSLALVHGNWTESEDESYYSYKGKLNLETALRDAELCLGELLEFLKKFEK